MVDINVRRHLSLLSIVLLILPAGCGSVEPETSPPEVIGEDRDPGPVADPAEGSAVLCQIPSEEIYSGGPGKDGIPALTNPERLPAADVDYLEDSDRVLGIELDGQWIATPHNVLWWHEIVNFDGPASHVAVTYCPLTGSGIAFDRSQVDNAEFGVSGLLYWTNLIMYDRNDAESLWSQMSREGSCGPKIGTSLQQVPVVDMTWAAWKDLHPLSTVVSTDTGYRRDYSRYPYGQYEALENNTILFPVPDLDDRLPPKERVLGLPDGSGGRAFPYGVLEEQGSIVAVNTTMGNVPVVVLWDGAAQAAVAFDRRKEGNVLEIEVSNGAFVDAKTDSEFRLDGRAIAGTLAGTRLEPVAEAYVAFWFAWALFQPDTEIWTPAE